MTAAVPEVKVRFNHYRLEHERFEEARRELIIAATKLGQIRASNGGTPLGPSKVRAVTVCTCSGHLPHAGGEVTVTGYAFCSMKDSFCKKTGRSIAEGRALKRMSAVVQLAESGSRG